MPPVTRVFPTTKALVFIVGKHITTDDLIENMGFQTSEVEIPALERVIQSIGGRKCKCGCWLWGGAPCDCQR